jgi:hypothetical protein
MPHQNLLEADVFLFLTTALLLDVADSQLLAAEVR